MSTNDVVNQIPFLRTSRNFPFDPQPLAVEVNKSYLDIANAVNARTIGLFPTNRAAITGESWFLQGNLRQQALRQVYNITSTANFNHGLIITDLSTFTVIRGLGYDGTNYYPLPYVHPTAANQIGMLVTPTQVQFTVGGGAPTITSGVVILEWLSDV